MGPSIHSLVLLKVCFFYSIIYVCCVGAAASLNISAFFPYGNGFNNDTVYKLPFDSNGDSDNTAYGLYFAQISAVDATKICADVQYTNFSATIADRNQSNLHANWTSAKLIYSRGCSLTSQNKSADGLQLIFETNVQGPINMEQMKKNMTIICLPQNSTADGCGVFEFGKKSSTPYFCTMNVGYFDYLGCLGLIAFSKGELGKPCFRTLRKIKDF